MRARLGATHCAGCGCLLQRHPDDDPGVPRRCLDCWRATPEAVIVAERRAYDLNRPAHRAELSERS
jgi:hypothetical protein